MSSPPRFSDDAAFRAAAAGTLHHLTACLDELDADVDVRSTPGNLQVLFEDSGATFVLSQQTPTHELWLSANLRAWHFHTRGGRWLERDTGQPLVEVFEGLVSEKVRAAVSFAGGPGL
jgi:iron donor protein CyaY